MKPRTYWAVYCYEELMPTTLRKRRIDATRAIESHFSAPSGWKHLRKIGFTVRRVTVTLEGET